MPWTCVCDGALICHGWDDVQTRGCELWCSRIEFIHVWLAVCYRLWVSSHRLTQVSVRTSVTTHEAPSKSSKAYAAASLYLSIADCNSSARR